MLVSSKPLAVDQPTPDVSSPDESTPAQACQAPGSPADLLADLTPSQHQAVTAASATVCVLASAGAGKTRVLTRRIGYRVATGAAEPEHVLAITFTRKAAGELRERLNQLGLARPVTAGTFHSLALSQLRRWWADRRTPEPALLERKGRLLGELVAGRPGLQDVGVGELASQIEWAKARLVEPAAFAAAAREARRELPADAEAIAALYSRYEDEKRRRRLVDFDDLLVRYAGALEGGQPFRRRPALALAPRLRRRAPGRQPAPVPPVAGPARATTRTSSSWATPTRPFTAGTGRTPRSWPISLSAGRRPRSSTSTTTTAPALRSWPPPRSVLGRQAHGGAVRASQTGRSPGCARYPSEEAEAAGVAAQLLGAHARGLRWRQMAVLVRAHSQASVISQALRRAGVPLRALVPKDGAELRERGARRGPGR